MQIQAADYPLQVEPAQVLGFDCGLGAGLRICIFFGNKTQLCQKNRPKWRFFCIYHLILLVFMDRGGVTWV